MLIKRWKVKGSHHRRAVIDSRQVLGLAGRAAAGSGLVRLVVLTRPLRYDIQCPKKLHRGIPEEWIEPTAPSSLQSRGIA